MLQAAGKAEDFESLLGEVETAQLEGSALDKACTQLQELVAQLQPAAGLLTDAGQHQGRSPVRDPPLPANCTAGLVVQITSSQLKLQFSGFILADAF